MVAPTPDQVVEYDPVPCKTCGSVLNPYAAVDFAAKIWTCPFCHTRNHFPPHYAGAGGWNDLHVENDTAAAGAVAAAAAAGITSASAAVAT